MFCKKCGHKREGNEKFYLVCGTPFPDEQEKSSNEEAPIYKSCTDAMPTTAIQYCKKCGHRQENGEKFCPVCGEPYLDANGKPYPRGMKKDLLNAHRRVTDKVSGMKDKSKLAADIVGKALSDAAQSGKQQFEQKVQPQMSEGLKQLRDTGWSEKQTEATSRVKDFLNDSIKTKRWSRIVAVTSAVLFLIFKAGFDASWFWLVLLGVIVVLPFLNYKNFTEERLRQQNNGTFILTLVLCLFILCFGPNGDNVGYGSSHNYDSSQSSDDEGKSDNGSYRDKVLNYSSQIESKGEEVERAFTAYRGALTEAGGNVMVAQRMYPEFCSQFRDKVNEYTSLCHRAADYCSKNGDQEQANTFRQMAIQLENSVSDLEGRP